MSVTNGDVDVTPVDQPSQPMQREKKFKCVKCQGDVVVIVPPLEIVNTNTVAMIVMPHTDLQHCEHCGQAYSFMLHGVKGLVYGFPPVEVQQQSLVQLAPPGARVPKIISN